MPTMTADQLDAYVLDVATRRRAELDTLIAGFCDTNKYPERPQLNLSERDDITIWLLGWRQWDCTPIHDHGNSDVGITVLRGTMTETAYRTELEIPHHSPYWVESKVIVPYRATQRKLTEGHTVLVPDPYTHKFCNQDPELCVTLHAYCPTLEHMRYWEETPQGLVYLGRWDDGEKE